MEDSAILRVTTYLEELSNVRFDHFPGLILQGLQVIHVGKGFVQCKLIITDRVLVIFFTNRCIFVLLLFFFFFMTVGFPGGKPRLIPTRPSIRARTVIGGKVAKATRIQGGPSSWSSITTRPRALG